MKNPAWVEQITEQVLTREWSEFLRLRDELQTYDDRRKGEPCTCGRVVSHGSPWGKRCGAVVGCKFDQRPARTVGLFAQPDTEDCE